MPGTPEFSPQDLRLMQDLAQQVAGLRPELVNAEATVGEMAWVWGVDGQAAGDDGFWTQFNRRELRDLPEPALPAGFSFATAEQVSPEAAAQAHRDAWHPSSFTDQGMRGVRETWPYRPGLHVLVRAPGGTLAATTIMWLDEANRTAEFEPVGTHQGYRRLGLARSLLRHGMRRAAAAGATEMLVACAGAPAHNAARALYYDAGFREFTRELPHIKPGPARRAG